MLDLEREMRREAQRRNRLEAVFSPKSLIVNDVEAFGLWLVTYFPHKLTEIEGWQPEPLRIMVEEPRGLILVPAQTMKTTIGSELYPIWRICQNRNFERAGFFKNDESAKESCAFVATELLANEKLIKDYGRFMPDPQEARRYRYKWNEHQLDVVGRTRRSRSSTLVYRGYSGQALGRRCHHGHLDDVILEDMACSPEQTRKFMGWLGSAYETMPYPRDSAADWDLDGDGGTPFEDQLLIYGTCWNDQDGYAKIENRNQDPEALAAEEFRPYTVCKVDLILDEETYETISPRWPAGRARAKKAEIGARNFNARYRNKPNDPETQVFKEAWFLGETDEKGIKYPGCRDGKFSMQDDIPRSHMVAIGYDPQSGSTTRYAKLGAVIMLSHEPSAKGSWNPRAWDWWAGQTAVLDEYDDASQLMVVVRMARRANTCGIVPVVVLESNQVQRGFKEPLEALANRSGVQLIVDLSHTGEDKHDASAGLESCAIDFQNGWLRLPDREPSDRDHWLGFIRHMANYGMSKYSDVPISYWKARRWLYDNRLCFSPREATVKKSVPPWMRARMARRGLRPFLRIKDAHSLRPPAEEIDLG